jgi:hypothetical protein
MEKKYLQNLMENLFSDKNEYVIMKREDALRLKEAVEELMETYSAPHLRKKLRNRDDIMELVSQFSSNKILSWLDRADEAGINYPYLSFELNERGISVSQAELASSSTIGGIVIVIENKMKESDNE